MSLEKIVSISEWVRGLPRGWRLTFFTVALIVTVVVAIPAIIMGLGYLVGFGECDRPDTATLTLCSAQGRLLLMTVLIAVGLPLARIWAKFLARTFSLEAEEAGPSGQVSSYIPVHVSKELSWGQRMMSGKIELNLRSAHTISVGEIPLTFWSVYAVRKGWLGHGDRTVVVYQRTFLRGLNLALAYWDGRLSCVRCVAPGSQTAALSIAVACIAVFEWLNLPFGRVWIALCGVLALMSSVYLMAMLRGRAALRHFIDSEAGR